jgi:hypothetical protein
MFFDLLIEQVRTFAIKVEADNQQDAERLGRDLLRVLDADTDDVTVQARAMVGV